MYKVKEVAKILNLSESTIRSWIFKKEIDYVKMKKSVRIPKEQVEKLLKGE